MQPDIVTQPEDGFLGAVGALAHRLHLPTTFIKFAIVGGIGFIIGQCVIFIVYHSPLFGFLSEESRNFGLVDVPDFRYFVATVVAVETAIIAQFNSHERWTFRRRRQDGWVMHRFIQFNLSAGVGAVIIVIAASVFKTMLGPLPDWLAPYASFALGVGIGFTWNWTMNSLMIWPNQRALEESPPAEPE